MFTDFQNGTGEAGWAACLADSGCNAGSNDTCANGTVSVAGTCCNDTDNDGNCDPSTTDPCATVSCGTNQYCFDGNCSCPDVLCPGGAAFDATNCSCGSIDACANAICPADQTCVVDSATNTAKCVCPDATTSPDVAGNCGTTCSGCSSDQLCAALGACVCPDGTPVDANGNCAGTTCSCPTGTICTADGTSGAALAKEHVTPTVAARARSAVGLARTARLGRLAGAVVTGFAIEGTIPRN